MNTAGSDEIATCPTCARDVTLRESLRESIQDSRSWFAAHPCSDGDFFPAVNNIKQMLAEGCDFASVVLDCSGDDRVVPTYANLRCLLDRMQCAISLLFADGAGWEFKSMARQQQLLDRKLQNAAPVDRDWVKRYLESIRHWNRQPDENGKPTSLRQPAVYKFKEAGIIHPLSREWYEVCSLYVHPTYSGEQNVGRGFLEGEVNVLIRNAHLFMRIILDLARKIQEAANTV